MLLVYNISALQVHQTFLKQKDVSSNSRETEFFIWYLLLRECVLEMYKKIQYIANRNNTKMSEAQSIKPWIQ